MVNCQSFKHLKRGVYSLVTLLWCLNTFAQNLSTPLRKPANYVPDDDMIIVPMVVERNFIEDFNEKHAREFKEARRKLDNWMTQEQFARDYGLEDTGFAQLPTPEQKEQFFHRNFLRFIQTDVDQSNQQVLNDFVNNWNSNDEIDSIKANEQRDEFIVKAKRSNGQRVYNANKEVKVAGKKFKFDVQPRIEMGMVKVVVDTPYFEMRGWLGVNGNQEVKIERRFASTGTETFVNYYIEQNRMLGVVEQPLIANWSLRLTHDKYLKSNASLDPASPLENNTLQLRFGMGF